MMAALTLASMTLGELLGGAAGSHADLAVNDLVMDSRQVTAGAAFVAVPGSRTHGLAFADAARARGAAVVLYEPSPGYSGVAEPSVALPGLSGRLGDLAKAFFARGHAASEVAAVTGTNGKTTIAYLVAQAMTELGDACAYIGTLGFGRTDALTSHELTTPDCLTLHREIAELGLARVALEASSHAIDQQRIAGLKIHVAAFSNLSRDHLDAHGSLERYAATKARLFDVPGLAAAVINIDDSFGAQLPVRVPARVRLLRVTLDRNAEAELTGGFQSLGLAGMTLSVDGAFGSATLRSPLIGDFNAENLMVALGSLLAWGAPLERAAAALAACTAPPGRMEVLGGQQQPTVVVDYAHTPAALERALAVLRPLTAGSITCVFGCGGDRDRGKRQAMGAVAAAGADRVIVTDDNPRHEDPARIAADILAGMGAMPGVRVEHARARAIEQAVADARRGDVVLIAGKGHERFQLVAGQRRPLDDRQVARAALGRRA